MDAKAFWDVIGNYNQKTLLIHIIMLIILMVSAILSYLPVIAIKHNNKFLKCRNLVKFSLGTANLFIGIVFFGIYGTEPIQRFFAFPLYIACGILFIYEAIRNKDDVLEKPNKFQLALLILYILYPLVSVCLGNSFPQMVTHIMPCPVVSFSIAVYSGYKKKNIVLSSLLTIWGLTG